MNPILYPAEETEFTSNGLGRLSEAISCKVTEERNGQFELEMVYPVTGKHYKDLALERLVYSRHCDNPSDLQPFRIYKITKPMDGKVTVNARHISYQLSKTTVMPFETTTCPAALNGLKTHSVGTCPFSTWTDITTGANKSFKVTEPSTFRSLLGGKEGSILDTFGGEYEWDHFMVKLHQNRGQDSGVVIRYGKNLTDVKETKDSTNLFTGIVPFWKGQDDWGEEEVITLEQEVVYSSPFEQYPFDQIIPVDLSGVLEDEPTDEELLQAATSYIAQNFLANAPSSIDVSFVHLWQTEEYASVAPLQRLRLCDTVSVSHELLGISYRAKIISVTYDVLLERYEKMTIGEARSSLSDGIKLAAREATQELPTMSAMQMAIAHATKLLTGGTGGYVVFGCNGDPDSDDYIPYGKGRKPSEIYIMDTDSVTTATNVLRINVNGIGFSSNGINGPYHSAWTLDGRFVADYITAGTLNAAQVDVINLDASNMTTGAFKIIKKDVDGKPILVNGKEQVLFLADADKGKVDIVADSFSFTNGDTIESIAEDVMDSYDERVQEYLGQFQDQIDGKVDWYFIHGKPTVNNSDRTYSISPNKEWTTNAEKEKHLGDCCYDIGSGKAYKWTYAAYGTTLAFDRFSSTYNINDYLKIYYKSDGKYRMLGSYYGSSMASIKVFVPAIDCYLYWHTNEVSSNAYGFKLTATREYGDPEAGVEAVSTPYSDKDNITAVNNRIPGWGMGEVSGTTYESQHYPYSENLDVFTHWTMYSSGSVTRRYDWVEIRDESVLNALGQAANAQDTADGKRRNFLVQPAPPYDVGDIWMDGKEIKTCIRSRNQGESFSETDWTAKNEYTDQEYVENELAKRDAHWSDEDTVFATLFRNGKRGFVYDPESQKMYISMDLMKGGTIKLGGTANNYGNGKFGLYDTNGKEIIWMDNGGMLVKDSSGHELMKLNPGDGFMVCTANGWGDEIIQLKDALILGYLGSTQKSGIDMVAQTDMGDGQVGHCLALWNNNSRIVTNSDIFDIESYSKFFDPDVSSMVRRRFMQCRSTGITAYVATYGFSDRRAKENITPASSHMEELKRLRVVSFDWKDGRYPGHVSAGLIAQEVREILPELVVEDSHGKLGVSFEGLVPFLLHAIQEKDRQIKTPEEKVTGIEKEVAGLQEKVKKLIDVIEEKTKKLIDVEGGISG